MKAPTKRRAWNSTIPAPTKPIARSTAKRKRKSSVKKSCKPIRKRNPDRMAKLLKRSALKQRKYMASECRRLVDLRADGQCEAWLHFSYDLGGCMSLIRITRSGAISPCSLRKRESYARCLATDRLQHHHLSYHNYGGGEVPEQMLKVCHRCHNYLESVKPTSRRAAQEGR